MKKSIILTSLLTLSSISFANVNTNIKSLDIYKNKSFVTQELNISSTSSDLIGRVYLPDVKFWVNGICNIEDTNMVFNNYSKDKLSIAINDAKRELVFKQNEIKSVKNEIASLSSIKYEKDAVNLQNIKDVSSFIKKETINNYNLIYTYNQELKKINEKLNDLSLKKSSDIYSKIYYNITCEKDSTVRITYPISNVSVNNVYDINAKSKESKVEIKNSAFLLQSSGFDFENIDVNLFSYYYSNQVNPNRFFPLYLDEEKKKIFKRIAKKMSTVADKEMMEVSMMSSPSRSVKSKPIYKESATRAYFKASNINLKSGENKQVVFSNETYDTKNTIEIDAYSASKAFYKVAFTSPKLYTSLNTKVYLDSAFVGNSYLKEIKKDKETYLYFSEDKFIDVKKELITDMKEKPFFSMSKLKTEKLWKYTITNNHKVKKTISLVERLPVSKHEDIKVKLISKIKYTKKDANGKISYDFDLKPNEKKIIEFGYEVEKPYKK
jgi:uncharacterized protein (TIGR02231 family)